MTKIAKLDLNQVNAQLDRIDQLEARIGKLEKTAKGISLQTAHLDFIHARPTINNLVFTWTGGSTTLSWPVGWIKDKNAAIDTGTAFSEAPSIRFQSGLPGGLTHNISVTAGSLVLTPSTYYWLGWDTNASKMYALTDVTSLFSHHNVQVICQLFTGTAGQTGVAGGGGSQGANFVDLSGARYKLF